MAVFQSNNEMKEVFIFGAGASNASTGTPLGNGLVWDYYPDCQSLYEIKPDGKPDLTELNERYDNYTSFLGLAEEIYPEFTGIKNKWKEQCKRGDCSGRIIFRQLKKEKKILCLGKGKSAKWQKI